MKSGPLRTAGGLVSGDVDSVHLKVRFGSEPDLIQQTAVNERLVLIKETLTAAPKNDIVPKQTSLAPSPHPASQTRRQAANSDGVT
jgi:hypothetical protein